MYIFNGPIGYEPESGNVYVHPEEIDAILVGQLPAGLSVDESRALLLQVISDPEAPWHAELK
jgi:hypothetical protein